MGYNDDVRLLIEMAHMYYGSGATQDEIAKKFNISRSLVSKYMSKAREMGLVEITIHDENLHPYKLLEEKLKKRFDLEDIICVNASDPNQIKIRIGIAAAKYLTRMMKSDSVIGVSAGTTVYEVASNINVQIPMSNVVFVPLVGGLGKAQSDIQANVICDIFTRRTGGSSVMLHVPVMVDDVNAKHVLMGQRFVKEVFDIARNVDIAVVGIGGQPAYFEMTKAYFHKVDPLQQEEAANVTGDICYNFIDHDGKAIESDWNKRVMALDLEDIKRIPLVIGCAGGLTKVEGIYASLVGQLINVLVTDVQTANKLLEMSQKENSGEENK